MRKKSSGCDPCAQARQHIDKGGAIIKLSTRNQIKGKVIEVVKGAVAAKVKIDIGGGNMITSTITVDAVNDLKLKKGDRVVALIKASSIMIGK